ncbi:5-hydroxytryptamine receptor 3A [Etheostoma spectabile]|uniref:5-hydroxytryptamine receptor 3A n=1 Tax=Etheostoma spectabile TaxID=54343 RepID=UPI0013AFAF4B|nr:5-hydroxytryptamine receptor 3A-like [Etheostoma spectabile]
MAHSFQCAVRTSREVLQSEMLRFLTHSLWKVIFLLSFLKIGCGHADSTCTTRRCLAEMLISQSRLSQPQSENCTQKIHVPFIEYQTLSVDTKNLRLISWLQAALAWTDPDLGWNTLVYPYNTVVLPVNTVWTPELHVTNGITTTMEHASSDLLVNSNGTVKHNVIIKAEVNCQVNLFNYPFASDKCPVAIQTWSKDGCGTELVFGKVILIDSNHGDWQTDSVALQQHIGREDRNYILVGLSLNFLNPFITLLLPSYLIILADVFSFSLSLEGGERNSFKVTLVLSFTMFLIILNDQLPGDSQCSPIIRIHFAVCLVLMVLSMLVSMMLTRLAKDSSLVFCSKGSVPENTAHNDKKEDEEVKADISVVQLNSSEEYSRMLRKVFNFLEAIEAQTRKIERNQMFANKIDKTYYWCYLILGSVYFFAMTYVMMNYKCTINHFDFWY